jgi:hypothetical protein
VVSPEGEAVHFELALKGHVPKNVTRICLARIASASPGEVSTFVNAVEFSKTGAATDGVKKPPTRARGHREHTHRIG